MFTLVKGKSGYYASIKQNLSACLSYVQSLDGELYISNGNIDSFDIIEQYIIRGVDLKRQFVSLNSDNRRLFMKTGFYMLDDIIGDKLKKLLKRKEFVSIALQYGANIEKFLDNPSVESADIFINSFVIKDIYFDNLKNRYQTRLKEVPSDNGNPTYMAYLTIPYDEIRLSKLKNYQRIKHILRFSSPNFVPYALILEKQDDRYLGTMPCGLQEIVQGVYNQDIKKKDLIQFLFKGYMFDNFRKQTKLLRKYSRKYKNYFYNSKIQIDRKKLMYNLEHKSDHMISKYVTSLATNIPMEIVIRAYLLGNSKYKEILSMLNEYHKENKKFFGEFPYFMKIFNDNFSAIYQNLDKHLVLLTKMYESFGPDFNYIDLVERETLETYFGMPFYVYRTDNIAENESLLRKIKMESFFSKIRQKFGVVKQIKEKNILTPDSEKVSLTETQEGILSETTNTVSSQDSDLSVSV